MSAQEILEMIEEVSPDDTAKLDEIDARVNSFIIEKVFNFIVDRSRMDIGVLWASNEEFIETGKRIYTAPRYTRSRDALKYIRPEGYISGSNPDFDDIFEPEKSGNIRFTGYCESIDRSFGIGKYFYAEELAELHAIIQAIEHERGIG